MHQTGDSEAVEVTTHTGGTVDFNGTITNSGNGNGIRLANNVGSVIRFDGGMSLSGSHTDQLFTATGGGTLHVTGTNMISATGTGGALEIADTTIGSDDVTFQSISSSGAAANGIVLDTTGTSGDFVVTGVGSTAGSGGTIQNTTGSAIALTDTSNVSFNGLNLLNIADNGVLGARVNGFSYTNATLTNIGDADTEDAFNFDRDVQGDVGLSGTALFQNLTITNFAERGIDIVNEGAGGASLDLDVINVSMDNNNDTFGEDGIRVQNEGNNNADVLVSGGTYNNLELDVIAYFAQGTGTNTVRVTGVTSTNGGGPDNNPNGGGIAIIGSGGSTTTFTIDGNTLTGVQGSAIQIIGLPGAGQTITMNGTIGGSNISDGNVISTDLGDGIDLDFDGDPSGTSTINGAIVVQNNTISFDDDGIGVDFRDAAGTMNVSILDNMLTAILGTNGVNDSDDGIFIFTDDDVGAGVGNVNLVIRNNEFNNLLSGNNIIVVEDVQDGNNVCLDVTGNSIASGFGEIELDTVASANLRVVQASAVALSTANNGIAVDNQAPGATFGSSICF